MEIKRLELASALLGLCLVVPVYAEEAGREMQPAVIQEPRTSQEQVTIAPEQKGSDAALKQSNYEDLSFTVEDTTVQADIADESEESSVGGRKFDINFDSADIIDVINQFSTERGVNILVPTGASEIKSKLTLKLDDRVTLDEAEKLLCTILDIAGYSMIRRQDGYAVVKNDNNISRNPLPIFVGMSPDALPDSDERIRYFYYFSNIQVPAIGAEGQSEINTIFQQLLPVDAVYKYVPTSNGVLLVDKSKNIKAAMNIVCELDKVGFKESLEILHLNFTNAQIVADLFNNNILGATEQQANKLRVGFRGKSQAEYFSTAMKIIPELRTNALILLGTQQSIDRVKDFIFRYIDVRLESGNSILHTYQLQYLEAATFAKTLEQLVTGSSNGGTGQSRAGGATGTGPERFFDGVIVRADTPASGGEGGSGPRYFGGNQLVIAARNEDWLRIKKLIEELDRPQPQVIIEVLIADLQITDEHVFGAHTRMPSSLNLPDTQHPNGTVQFQSASSQMALATPLADGGPNVNVDLLNKAGYTTAGGGTTITPLQTVATGGTLDTGSTVISLNDSNGNTWSILQILQSYENSKILAHPHVVATNNQEALVEIGEVRMLQAEATIGQGGAAIAKLAEKPANMTVRITPRISGGEIVNMQVSVNYNEFVGETANRIVRQVVTNANVHSGTILALGGLIKVDTQQGLAGTPLLSRIPILGYFFKKRTGSNVKNNLTVFIRPTIIMPRLRGGIDRYTKDYIDVAKKYVDENMLFDTLRDPITRWFFTTGVDAKSAIDTFATDITEQDEDDLVPEDRSIVNTSKATAGNLRNDTSRTVLAAAEHRKPKRTKVLEMKNDLMDFSSKQDTSVVAREELQHDAKKASRDEKRKMTGHTTEVAQATQPVVPIQPVAETKVAVTSVPKKQPAPLQKAPVSLTREEQLKRLLAQQDNPLLTV